MIKTIDEINAQRSYNNPNDNPDDNPDDNSDFYGGISRPTEEELNDLDDYNQIPLEQNNLGGVYKLFEKVMDKSDSTKVSNLTKEEIGENSMSLRGNKWLELIGNTFQHVKFGKFFRDQGRIVSDTAMSKEGWFSELFVTAKKFATRDSTSNIKNIEDPLKKKKKWAMFSK